MWRSIAELPLHVESYGVPLESIDIRTSRILWYSCLWKKMDFIKEHSSAVCLPGPRF
jgi:hypothetical protein